MNVMTTIRMLFFCLGKTCWNLWQCGEWKNFTYFSNFRAGEMFSFDFCSSFLSPILLIYLV